MKKKKKAFNPKRCPLNYSSSWTSLSTNASDKTLLYYEKQSHGKTIVLCDGLFCNGHVWKYFTPHFSNQYQLLHWHYPGHGESKSPRSTATLSITRLSHDLAAILKIEQLEKVVLVGHSLGVQVALETAYNYPKLVEALVLICGASGKTVRTFHDSLAMKQFLPFLSVGTRFIPRYFSKLWKLLPSKLIWELVAKSDEINKRLINMEDLSPYFKGLKQTDINVAIRILEQADEHDMQPLLSTMDVRTLVIAGKKDRFTPSYRSRQIADAMPNAEFLLSNQGTHSLPLEQPELVNLAVERFLESIS